MASAFSHNAFGGRRKPQKAIIFIFVRRLLVFLEHQIERPLKDVTAGLAPGHELNRRYESHGNDGNGRRFEQGSNLSGRGYGVASTDNRPFGFCAFGLKTRRRHASRAPSPDCHRVRQSAIGVDRPGRALTISCPLQATIDKEDGHLVSAGRGHPPASQLPFVSSAKTARVCLHAAGCREFWASITFYHRLLAVCWATLVQD
ncbi:MAG: hypothetical protein Q9174_000475 [Haloplaca sp. 1 TL-2023]